MFFLASKTLDLVVDPLWWAGGLVAVGLWLLRFEDRRARAGRWFVSALVVLAVAGSPAVSSRLMWSLEQGAPAAPPADQRWDVVVLLGGTVDFGGAMADEVAWNDNVERLTVVYDLLRSGRAGRAIVSGGHGAADLPTEAEYLQRQLVAWGVDPARVEVEPRARNTRENATFSQSLIEAHGDRSVLLVTSAHHVPRALGCFRAVGLNPDVWPADWKMRDPARVHHWSPRAEAVGDTARALREYLGRLVYRVMGYAK